MAEKTGTYTAFDYADIMDHLITRWKVPEFQHLSGDAAEVCRCCVSAAQSCSRACCCELECSQGDSSCTALPPPHLGTHPIMWVPFGRLQAQEYLVKLPNRIRKLSERAAARKAKNKGATAQFSWIFNRQVELI